MSYASAIHEIDAGEFTVRSLLIQGRRFCLVWDTLTRPEDMDAFMETCDRQQCFVVYSHADWDHIQGTAALRSPLIVAHRECSQRFEGEAQRTLAEMQVRKPGKFDAVQLIPPDITFDRHLDIDLGGISVSLHALPGHTPDSIAAFIPAMKFLLIGDAVELPWPCVPAGCNLDKWIRALTQWREHKGVRTVIPSHGPTGGKELLDQTIAYLDALRRGCPPPLPGNVPPFYAKTYRDNLRNCNVCAS